MSLYIAYRIAKCHSESGRDDMTMKSVSESKLSDDDTILILSHWTLDTVKGSCAHILTRAGELSYGLSESSGIKLLKEQVLSRLLLDCCWK